MLPDQTKSAEFPPPLSMVDRWKRSATFLSAAAPIVARYFGLMGTIKLHEDLLGKEYRQEDIENLWDAQHADSAQKLYEVILDLKGFYVKSAQIVSSQADLFPKQYTDVLSGFSDNLDPMPASLAKAVVEQELLNRDERFEDIFREFDEIPLGAASVAQVHRAVLTEKYGGREVAVKIQRPSIESKLLGDIANLKAIAKTFRNVEALALDYYTVFSELETQLADEFDFVAEAVAMDRIYNSLAISLDGTEMTEIPVVLPRPVRGLVSRRVLVMDYLEGAPLSRKREEMEKKGIDENRPEAKLFGRRLLKDLTLTFGRNILKGGFFHADPHPGNIFVLENGDIGLIDFGQVKQISGRYRETLAKMMVALDENDGSPKDLETIGKLALDGLGLELKEDAKEHAAAAVAIWMFDGSVQDLPGGYDSGELSPNSPMKQLKSFPQDLVLVARSSMLIKGLSRRFGIPWSLAKEWAPIARESLNMQPNQSSSGTNHHPKKLKSGFKSIKKWSRDKLSRVVFKLPGSARSQVAVFLVKADDRKMKRL